MKKEIKKRNRNLEVTEKDYQLIELVDRWNYLTVEEIALLLRKAESTIKWRVKRLIDLKLLKRDRELIGKDVYFKKVNRFKLPYYNHDHSIKVLATYLSKKYDCEYATPKELVSDLLKTKGVSFLGAKVPDLLLLKDGKKIAIESEITQKQMKRQEANLDKYKDDLSFGNYSMVIYFCGSEAIKERLDKIILDKGIINMRTAIYKEDLKNE